MVVGRRLNVGTVGGVEAVVDMLSAIYARLAGAPDYYDYVSGMTTAQRICSFTRRLAQL